MGDVMATGRLSKEKKLAGVRVLDKEGITVSQAINLLFDRLIEDGNADFLKRAGHQAASTARWELAASFVDSLPKLSDVHALDIDAEQVRMRRLGMEGYAE